LVAGRIAKHPMYSPSDLKYLRKKGYTDREILAFWDRDHGQGCQPVEHRFTYTGTAAEVVRDVLHDNLSPQAVAAIAAHLFAAGTKDDGVNKEKKQRKPDGLDAAVTVLAEAGHSPRSRPLRAQSPT
jgi:hypothetical protein